MTDVVVGAAVAAGLAAILAVLALLAARVRRRGAAGAAVAAAMAAYDEAMHSTAHDSFIEVQEQDERKIPAQADGDR